MFKHPVKILLLFMVLLFSHQAWSSVGSIVLATGQVDIQRADQLLQATTGATLFEQDKIYTRENARAQLRFSDDTVITLGSQSEFAIESFLNEGTNNSEVKFNIATGTFKAITGKIGKVAPEKFKVKTRTATIGIRGTIFTANISTERELIATISGEITVMEDQTGAMVNVPAGQMTQVLPGQAPQAPTPFSTQDLDAITDDSSDGEEGGAENSAANEQVDDTVGFADTDETAGNEAQPPQTEISTVDQALNTKTEKNKEGAIDGEVNSAPTLKDFSAQQLLAESLCTNQNPQCEEYGSFESRNELPGELVGSFESHIGWGTWEENGMKGYWVGGNHTQAAADHVQALIDGATGTEYTYSGRLMGEVATPDGFEKITSSDLALTFEFGGQNINGTVSFQSENTEWALSLEGRTYSSEEFYSSVSVGVPGEIKAYGDVVTTTPGGIINGQFFGPNAESVGGSFSFDDYDGQGSYSANGVFKATR